MNERILNIPDMHAPFGHPDTEPFLREVKQKYKPTRIICLGDEVDRQGLKFHPVDPDLPSTGDELELAILRLQPIFRLFPNVDVLDSNHGSLAYRKALVAGISRKYLRSYKDVLSAPSGWNWHNDLIVTVGKSRIYYHHGITRDAAKVVKQRGMSFIQGHFHEEFSIQFIGNPDHLLFGMTSGCLVDTKSLAFAYNQNNIGRPILGCSMVIRGWPKLLPMYMDAVGRWVGNVP